MRIKYLVFVLVSLLVVLCSCGNNDSKETSVNDLLAKDYSNIQIETITSNEGMSTKAVYDVKKEGESYILEYSIEQYNRLSLDEEPTGEKTTKTGKIKIAGSKHEVISGEDINIDLSTLSLARFKYDSKTFDSLEVKDNTLTASLKNGKAYSSSLYL